MNRQVGGVAAAGFEDHGKIVYRLRVVNISRQLTSTVSLPGNFNLWLASPEAKFLKGKFLWANWDVDELMSRAEEIGSSTQLNLGLVGWPWGEDGPQRSWKF